MAARRCFSIPVISGPGSYPPSFPRANLAHRHSRHGPPLNRKTKERKKMFREDSRTRCLLRMYSRALTLDGPRGTGCLLDALNVNFYAVGKVLSPSTEVRIRREEMKQSQRKRKKVFFHIYSTPLTCVS